jgi:iron complex transport system ATP-binding protein
MTESRLELNGVHVELGGKAILRGVSLALARGDLRVLVGPNGAGKTTLFRAALDLVRPVRGSVLLDGRPVSSWRAADRAARIAWLPQQESVQEDVRVLELVAAARFRFTERRAWTEARARAALDELEAGRFAERRLFQLSGGERQRVAIAGLLAQEAPLLLLDEPANHLDPAQQIEIYRTIGRLRARGFGILCITHDLGLVNHARAAEAPQPIEVVGLADGEIRFAVDFRDPALGRHLADLFGVAVRTIEDGDGSIPYTRHFLFSRAPGSPTPDAPATLRTAHPPFAPDSRGSDSSGRDRRP